MFACCIPVVYAVAGEPIGFAYVDGAYRMNGTAVRGNSTLFEGAKLEIGDAPGSLHLNSGASVWLAPGSRTQVLRNSVLLLAGLGQLRSTSAYALDTRVVRIVPSEPDSLVRVQVESGGAAIVTELRGAAEVLNNRGVHVGTVVEGSVVRFAEHSGPSDAVRVSGCIVRDGDSLMITDRITKLNLQVRGAGIEREVGHAVDLAGTEDKPDRSGAPMLVRVSELRRIAGDCQADRPLLMASARTGAGQETAAPVAAALSIVIVDGEGAINNIRQRTAREPIVQVEDRNRKPVAGALVTFALPDSGPSATFANGARILTVTTDAQGRAVAHGLKPNNITGQYKISVSASFGAATATALITQTNALVAAAAAGAAGAAGGAAAAGGVAAGGGLSSAATIAIVGGVAAAGVVGGLAATGAIFGSSSPAPPASR